MRTGRISGSKDGAHVVRILDPIQHHEQRRPLRDVNQLAEAVLRDILYDRDDPLMDASTCIASERLSPHPAHTYTSFAGEIDQLLQSAAAPIRHPELLDTPA